MRSKAALAYSLLFFWSGATALVYELLWIRLLYQAFGSTIQSVTTVVAAYMGGLGLGAWLLGSRGDSHPRPAALYGWLEIAIGCFGLASPLVFGMVSWLYVSVGGALQLEGAASMLLRFSLAGLALLVPTTLMGGTLPVLTRAFAVGDRGALRRTVGSLYGLNTLGAMTGTALAGFLLIEHVGIRLSLWLTGLSNLALGLWALWLARSLEPAPPATPAHLDPSPSRALRRLGLVLLGVTAFASLLDEVAWTRVLVMIVGGSTYAFTLVLLTFLLGIGLGSVLVARRGAPEPETGASAALAQGVTAAGAALLLLFLGVLPGYIVALFQFHELGSTARLLLLGTVVAAVVVVPAIGMGMSFPLLNDLVARAGDSRARDVGRAYAINTGGSIAGAVLTGFVLVVWLGTDLTLRLGVLVNAASALVLAVLVSRGVAEGSAEHGRLRVRVVGGGLLASLALAAAVAAPRWSTRLIDLGPAIYARRPMDAAARRAFLQHAGSRQLAFREGWNATVSVWEAYWGHALKVNGKTDASDYGDMDTEVLVGLAPVAARSGAASALVIGYGSGVTTRVLAAAPGMQRVRVVEIEPAVLAMDRYFRHVNDSVLDHPIVTVQVDDARSALQLSHERFDIIVSEPSNPWLAGVATLYTPEFFDIVRHRLGDEGVFCQWLQLYQLPLPVLAGIVGNLRTVFPNVEVWFSYPGDLVVLGSRRPFRYDPAWLARLMGPRGAFEDVAREYLNVDTPADYFGHFLLGSAAVSQLVARGAWVHRDDRPQLEFVAARRFLDNDYPGDVFDSLAALGGATLAGSGPPRLLLAKALSTRPGNATVFRYVDPIRRAHPDEPVWTVEVAAMRVALGDTAFADTALARIVARAPTADALLLSGVIATARNQGERARPLLRRALAAGADSAWVGAGLAVLAARAGRWADAIAGTRAAMRQARGTLRHPIPGDLLRDALTRIALHAPPAAADSLMAESQRIRPGWANLYELRGIVELRQGLCAAAAKQFLVLVEFGLERRDAPELVVRCERGLAP